MTLLNFLSIVVFIIVWFCGAVGVMNGVGLVVNKYTDAKQLDVGIENGIFRGVCFTLVVVGLAIWTGVLLSGYTIIGMNLGLL